MCIRDSISGEEVTIYDADTDMQSKVDLFVNPIYYFGTNADSAAAFPTSLYFNGNDAITLEMLGSGIVLDLIGKVGEDPGAAWSDNDGNYWTRLQQPNRSCRTNTRTNGSNPNERRVPWFDHKTRKGLDPNRRVCDLPPEYVLDM